MNRQEKVTRFLALHAGPRPFVLPNPWDAGSAKVMIAAELPSTSRSQRTVACGSISTRPLAMRTSCPSRGRINARCGPNVTASR
jgi:hypothetical protein